MVTVQQIYDMAIHLMDEQSEVNGETVTTDTQEYKYRTISILNSIIPVLYPYSGDFADPGYGRPVPAPLWADDYKNPEFQQAIPLDDGLSMACLPYFLAAQLLSSENDTLSNWFMNQYRLSLSDIKSKVPATFEAIKMPYGAF